MIVKHIKTGRFYFVFSLYAINCTNGSEDETYVIYFRNPFKKIFIRKKGEFLEKFKRGINE